METKLDINKEIYALTAFLRFDKFQQKNLHCDFEIKVCSDVIPTHRIVLAGASDYFSAMLSHDTAESRSGFVTIMEADAESVQKCVDFMYNREVSITKENCGRLMHVAHMLQLRLLSEAITTYLGKTLDLESFFLTKQLASTYSCEELDEKCDKFALHRFRDITAAEQFRCLDEAYVLFLIRSENANASVGLKLDALLAWVKHQPETRKESLMANMSHLDLLSIPLEYRRHLVENEPLIYINAELIRLFTISILDSRNIEAKNIRRLESECSRIVVFDRRSKSLQAFKPEHKTWEKMHKLSDEIVAGHFSAVVLGRFIYVLLDSKCVHRLVYCKPTNTWERVEDMEKCHGRCPPVTTLNDCIYVVGGWDPVLTTSVEMYDPSEKAWKKIRNKQLSCTYSTTVSSGGLLYSIGGTEEDDLTSDKVERFDPATSKWEFIAPMSQPRDSAAAVDFQGKVYVFGGFSNNNVSGVEYFDPEQNIWTSVAPMIVGRSSFRAVIVQGAIFVVGAEPKSYEKYSAEEDKWETVVIWNNLDIDECATIAI